MEQDDGSEPTAWFQPPITTTRRRNPSIEPVILILLPILVLLLLFFFLHPLQSHIPKTIKPTFLKSNWDSLNVFLVFFAIICGVFASTNNNTSSTANATNPVNNLVPGSYEYEEHEQVNGGLRRSSRSYPDLRRESESLREKGENGIRFYDDSEVDIQNSSSVNNRSPQRGGGKEDMYRSETISGDIRHRPRRREAGEVHAEGSTKLRRNVPVSMVQLRLLSPPAPSPAPPLSVSVKTRRRRSSRSLGRDETVDDVTSRIDKIQIVSQNPSSSTMPPPPPLLVPSEHRLHQKHDKLEGTLSESTSELATKIDSVDDQRKRKRKSRQKPTYIQPVTPSIQPPVLPPAPPVTVVPPPAPTVTVVPPPPPLRTIFNAIFKTVRKTKRLPSKISPPPSPPPPSPSSTITGFFKTGTKSKHVNSSSAISPPWRSTVPVTLKQESKRMSQIKSPSQPLQRKPEALRWRSAGTDKPPLPTKTSNFYDSDDFLLSGSHSPMISIPTPPPPAMKFELRGDSVKSKSIHESVCSSPEHGPVDFRSPSTSTSTAIDVEDSFGPSPISFPSPDVNVKADSFISRRKDEWRMENIKFL
ncbi:uncharacterized protein LOC111919940 [Lactuca sativa]|uniref:Uncharacterized protein n=1 Tax=Lactuca sativa TaxID=4236 RepID=A0A9R1WYR8_LACSA|nr:uncharacterized protein LOC111919940 [Lactuca sativa]KAJ0192621.1 hypothetical protein LSAT_V11C800423400 [Lactuca sativa]